MTDTTLETQEKLKPELIDLELFGEPIIKTAQLLGILHVFDRRLRFNDYMKDLMTKVYRRLNLLKLLKGTNWGAKPPSICMTSVVSLWSKIGRQLWRLKHLDHLKTHSVLRIWCWIFNHEIVQKQSGSNTILDQSLAAIQTRLRLTDNGWTPVPT